MGAAYGEGLACSGQAGHLGGLTLCLRRRALAGLGVGFLMAEVWWGLLEAGGIVTGAEAQLEACG